jgi:hypothetical protein
MKLPIRRGVKVLSLRFEAPIVFTRVNANWRTRCEGYFAIVVRSVLPKISFYWGEEYDADF